MGVKLAVKGRPECGTFREGARSGHVDDICPRCKQPCCLFATDFKKFGRQSVRVCHMCCTVHVNGKKTADLEMTLPA